VCARASKFLGCKGFLPKFSQTCPKSCHAAFADHFYGVTSKKWSSLVFLQSLGAIFRSQTSLGAIFAQIFRDFAEIFMDFVRIFRDFAKIFRDFAQIFRDFAQIFNKSKLLGVRLHPRLLHHCIAKSICRMN